MMGLIKRLGVFLVLTIFVFLNVSGQRGKDGVRLVNGTQVVNEFTNLTADAIAGGTSISVGNSNLNANGRYPAALAAGDLIMIIQIQGASMSTVGSPAYGAVTNYNNCGLYEFVEVHSVPNGTTINLSCGLTNGYTASGRTQIVRVPRFSSLTVQAGATLTTDNWNGAIGGVLAVEVLGVTTVNATGAIDATGRGLRGGVLENDGSPFNISAWFSNIATNGGEKGESIVGFGPEYDAIGGRYCKGAPANAGGGGNGHNGGGGGGGNGGNPATWNGLGNPDISGPNWANAWNLEAAGFANNVSSGGGRGGYTYSGANQNALTVGPGNGAWAGDSRRNNGGYGGRPLDYSSGRLFLGGGGGAGDENNNSGGAGGNGGGLVYMLSYDAIGGAGEIRSNGANGANTMGGGNDGPGGAGGGGTVILNASIGVSGISVLANGGRGGNQIIGGNEAEGPGGGGGGGYIAVSAGNPTRTANGGANGTSNSAAVTEFIPNGATRGGVGTPNAAISNFSISAGPDTVCSGNTATLTATLSGTVPAGAVIVWSDAETGGATLGTGANFTTPVLFSTTTFWVGTCPGTYRIPVEVFVRPVPQASISGPATVCANSSGSVYTSPNQAGHSYAWTVSGGSIASGQGTNSVNINWGSAGNGLLSLTETDIHGCDTTVTYNVAIQPRPTPLIAGPLAACENTGGHIYSVQNIAGHTYAWAVTGGAITAGQGSNSLTVSWGGLGAGTVTLQQSSPLGCDTTVSYSVNILNKPNPSISGPSPVCANASGQVYTTANTPGNNYLWTVTGGAIAAGQGSNSITVTWGAAGNGLITLQEGAPGNCDTTVSFAVTIHPRPAPVISGPLQFCENTAGATYSTANNAGNTYVWTVTGGSITAGQGSASINVHWGSAGAGSVQVTETNGFSCSQSSTVNVTVDPKPNPVIIGPVNNCENELGSYAVTAIPGNTYVWTVSGGQISFGQGTNNISVLWGPAGGGNVQLLQSNPNGCDSLTNFAVTVNPKPTPVINGTQTVCAQQSGVTYNTANVAGNSYNWTVSGGSIASGQGSVSVVVNWGAVPGVGTLTLTETNAFTCDTTVSYTVTINPLPNPQITGDFAVCAQSQGDIYSVNNTPGSTYNWTISGGNIIAGQGSNQVTINWGNAGTGSLTLTETNSFGCVTTVNAAITISPNPTPALSGPQTLCANDPPSTYSVSGTPGSQFSWIVTGGSITSGQGSPSITVNWAGASNGTVELTETTVNGCQTTVAISVVINPAPNPLVSGPSPVCERTENHVYTTAFNTGNTYAWSVTGGTINSGQGTNSISVAWFGQGTGSVSVTETNGFGCLETYAISINIQARPAPVISGPLSWCENEPNAGYSVANVSGASYQWTVSGGTIAGGQGSSSLSVDWGGQGQGSISLYQQNPNGCDTTVSISINIRPVPIAVVSPVDTQGCAPLLVNFDASQSLFSDFYTWSFGDGGSGSGQSSSHTFYNPGAYTVQMIARNAWGCRDTANANVDVFANPIADFALIFSGGGDEYQIPYDSLLLSNLSSGALTWNWDFGDGSTDTLFQPTHSYTDPGEYTVGLEVRSAEGCFDESSQLLTVSAPIKLFVPTGFTPNGDFVNDDFYVVSTNVTELNVLIFDRWGKLIYESDDVSFRWGGRFREQLVPEGVYVYKIVAKSLDGRELKKNGTITVLR